MSAPAAFRARKELAFTLTQADWVPGVRSRGRNRHRQRTARRRDRAYGGPPMGSTDVTRYPPPRFRTLLPPSWFLSTPAGAERPGHAATGSRIELLLPGASRPTDPCVTGLTEHPRDLRGPMRSSVGVPPRKWAAPARYTPNDLTARPRATSIYSASQPDSWPLRPKAAHEDGSGRPSK